MQHWRVFDVAIKTNTIQSSALVQEPFDIIIDRRVRLQTGDRHEYYIGFKLKNIGTMRIDDFRVDIEFPLTFMNLSTSYWLEVREHRTETHMLFRKWNPDPHTGARTILYPDDEVMVMSMEYFITTEIHDSNAMKQKVRITVYSGDLKPLVKEIPITELSDF